MPSSAPVILAWEPPPQQSMGSVDDVTVVALTREDLNTNRLQEISELNKEAMSDAKPCCCCMKQGLDEIKSTFSKGLAESPDSKFDAFAYAISPNGTFLGYIMLGFHDTPGDVTMRDVKFLQEIPPPGTCHLEQIAVTANARGKGVSTKLMAWAENKAKEKGCNRIRLEVIRHNSHAKAVYEKTGYVTLGTCCKQCCWCPLLCCLMTVPYTYTMEKQL